MGLSLRARAISRCPSSSFSCSVKSQEQRRSRPLASPVDQSSAGAVMEQLTGGNLLSMLLITSACTFTLGLVCLPHHMFSHLPSCQPEQNVHHTFFSSILFLEYTIAFGESPLEFLENTYEKYGPIVVLP